MKTLLREKVKMLLKESEFVYVATCSFDTSPSAAPKLLLKAEDGYIYLIDFVKGPTYENLKLNPKVSVAVMNHSTLHGYQMNGVAELIQQGSVYDQMIDELDQKKIRFTTERIIEAVRTGRTHENFEMGFPKDLVVLKIAVDNIVEIEPQGKLSREKILRTGSSPKSS